MILVGLAILACILAGLWTYARWNFGTLEKMGIPVVKYTHPILGSTRDIYTRAGGELDVEWMRKYGNIFGFYEGRTPIVVVCVPELIRQICVKDAHHFSEKRELDFGDPMLNDMPDFIHGDKWKILRTMTTPAFSTAKLKMMNLPIRDASLAFVEDLKDKIKMGNGVHKKIAIDTAVFVMITDVISRTFFNIHIGGRGDVSNEFTQIVQLLFSELPTSNKNELTLYTHSFPFLKKFISAPIFNVEPCGRFRLVFKQMMNERKKSGQKLNDVLDIFIEAWEKLDTPEYKKAGVTEDSLLCQAIVFFAAGQDQMSTMVAAVIYNMTQDPELEKKIYEEVDSVFEKNGEKLGHEHLSELPVLQACLSECLRLYSVFHRAERVCSKDWRNEEYNLTIKKGTVIGVPIWALNRNAEFNENPDKFDYERFMPENKDKVNVYASSSFGHGPRQCTGKRFALEAMPLILAYMLRELKFKKRDDTKIEFMNGGFLITPHKEIFVDMTLRKEKLLAPSY